MLIIQIINLNNNNNKYYYLQFINVFYNLLIPFSKLYLLKPFFDYNKVNNF